MWKVGAVFSALCLLLAVGPLATNGQNAAAFDPCVSPVHYCLAVDSSNSVTNAIWKEMTRIVGAIAVGFNIGPAANESKVAMLKYGRDVFREIQFANNTDKDKVVSAIINAPRIQKTSPGGTVTPDAIEECVEIFEEQGQAEIPKVIMIFSDGVTHYARRTDEFDYQRLNESIDASRAAGTINFAVYFSNTEPVRAEMEATIITGDAERTIFANSFDDLKTRALEVLSCVCTYTQGGVVRSAELGQPVVLDNPCLQCMCVADEVINCTDISPTCPPPPSSCPPGTMLDARNVTSQCCLVYSCVGFCTPTSPCQNGGTCDEITDTCMCPTGYSGDLCDEFCTFEGNPYAVGDMIPSGSPCIQLMCVGTQNISRIDLCQNGGTCDEVTDTCMCPTGYSGDLCDEFCMDNGTPYAVGDSVPSTDPCMMCECVGHQNITCTDISGTCPPPPSCPSGTSTERVNVTGECCPNYTACTGFCTPTSPCQNGGTCDETTDTCMCDTGYSGELCDEFCMDNGTPYAVGDSVPSTDPCMMCTCVGHGDIQCTDISGTCPPPPSCPPGTNYEADNVTGQCCPNYTACTGFCTPTSPCQNGGTCDETTDTCMCDTGYSGDLCDEFCTDNGTPYAVGDTVPSTDPCMMCTCAAHDDIQCTAIPGTCPPPPSCPPGTNYETVNVAGQCCPNYTACTGFCTPTSPCQNGGTCDETTDTCMCDTGYSGDLCDEFCTNNGTPFAVGDNVPSTDACMMCTCAAHNDIQCTDISGTCPSPPSCPPGTNYETDNVTGQCCPNYTACTGFCTPTSPCQNGGTCDETTDTCMCDTGYSGELCDEFCTDNGTPYAVGDSVPSTDPCMMCTCAAHDDIQCTDISGTCPPPPSCPPGTNYEADNVTGQCCPNYTACTGFCTPTSPCQNGGTCDETTDTCMCDTGYSGDLCDEFCLDNGTPYAVGDSVPSTDPCMMCTCAAHNDIQCTDISVSCPTPPPCDSNLETIPVPGQCCPDYTCTDDDFCTPTSPCQNGGTCDEVTDTCMCPTGFFGDLCAEMAAVAVSPNQTTVGRVTQTLLIHCVARGNVNDSAITFTWKQGDRVLQRNVISGVFGGEAASVLEIRGLSVDEHDGLSIQCHPSNSIGGVNFTEFIISVEPFPAPSITSFRRQDGGSNMATAEWQPLNVSGYPDASFDDYFYEIATDSNGNNIVFNGTVNAGNISLVYSFGDELSDRYWVRVKAVKGDQDVSTFSPWFPITPTRRPPGPISLSAWAIFLIVLIAILFCLILIFLFCIHVALIFWCRRYPKGEYFAEAREAKYRESAV